MSSEEYDADDSMLTTYDNPYDPFTEYESWYRFDISKGTDCCGYLARLVESNDIFDSNILEEERIVIAMNKIVKENGGLYIIVHPGDERYQGNPEDFSERSAAMTLSLTE